MLNGISRAEDAGKVANRVLEALRRPFVLDGHEVFATASLGIAVFPFDGEDAETLLRNADTAMYWAKDRGRNNFQFYAKSMNAAAKRKLDLEKRLRRALERQEFSLVYQPVRETGSGRLTGAEALLRWQDPEIGAVSPDEFIPIAEETSLIIQIGAWVLRTACAQHRAWQAAGFRPVRLAVNLSGHQLRQPTFSGTVARNLQETGLSPAHLELEITESAIMQDDDVTITSLRKLDEMGIGLALDDFGTGYSSLSLLRHFPIGRVKIDRSFVREISTNSDDAALTAAIIAMAHSLHLRVVAEGVETPEQAFFLGERGCDELQGFLFSPGIPADEFVRFLEQEKSSSTRGQDLDQLDE
jgi:EAL domain-containing protein (putative c-di-GMP-specific phosphodiesterase class I)